MTRIIAGIARGRRLEVPARGTRPTSDRIREALFSALDSAVRSEPGGWAEVVALDLYAGTGALGLEALSRGARAAYLVESGREALRVLRRNIDAVALDGATVVPRRVAQVAGPPPGSAATLVLVDPPYDVPAQQVAGELAMLAESDWIAADAQIVVERPARDRQSPFPGGWDVVRERDYGDTTLWYGRAQSSGAVAEEEQD